MSATFYQPSAAFDEIAAIYDDVFTNSLIGKAQRELVWKQIDRIWKPGDRILELNCGTGEDALHLAERGINVIGCDASAAMIEVAAQKLSHCDPPARVQFVVLPNEHIGKLPLDRPFDGVFSNFSGLNCVANLADVARQLAALVHPGAELAVCFSTRFSAWEFAWYSLKGDWSRATRRWSGHSLSSINGQPIDVWYPAAREIRDAFAPWFRFVRVSGIGVAIPPSYVESWAQQHRTAFSALCKIDNAINQLPCFRVAGDHMLLHFRRPS